MHEYAVSVGMPEVEEETRFYLYRDVAAMAPVFEAVTGANTRVDRKSWYEGDGRVAEQFRGSIFLTTSGYTTDSLTKIAAHELSHAQASAIAGFENGGGTHEVQTHGPVWIREGIAELHGHLVMDQGGFNSYLDFRASNVSYTRASDFPPLRLQETWEQNWAVPGYSYGYFVLAAELLASQAGEDALIEYFTLLQPGTTWEEAFQTAFGMTVEEFYVLFEAYRAAGYPEVDFPERVDDPAVTATPMSTPSDILDWFDDPPDDAHSLAGQ